MKTEQGKKSNRGGYLMMPLKENIPCPKVGTWTPAVCPRCGCECWDVPLPRGFTAEMFDGKLCSMCALRAGVQD